MVSRAGMREGFTAPMITIISIIRRANTIPVEMPHTSALPMETPASREKEMMGTLGGMSTDREPAQVMVPMDSVSS